MDMLEIQRPEVVELLMLVVIVTLEVQLNQIVLMVETASAR